MMDTETISTIAQQFPNFAGFALLGILLYRALMKALTVNEQLSSKLIECYRDRAITAEKE